MNQHCIVYHICSVQTDAHCNDVCFEGDPSGVGIPAGTRLHSSEKLLHWIGSR